MICFKDTAIIMQAEGAINDNYETEVARRWTAGRKQRKKCLNCHLFIWVFEEIVGW